MGGDAQLFTPAYPATRPTPFVRHASLRRPVRLPVRGLQAAMAATLAVCAALLGTARSADASCGVMGGAPPANPYAQAPVVFVGTVASTTHGGRLAVVDVESVWNGPDLPPRLEVRGSPAILTPVPAGMGVATSVDRHFQAGGRYLFVPANRQPPFEDNSCSLTRVYAPDVDALRPARARPPLLPLATDPAGALPNAPPAADPARGAALPSSGEAAPRQWPVASLLAVGALGALGAAGALAHGTGRRRLHLRRAAGRPE